MKKYQAGISLMKMLVLIGVAGLVVAGIAAYLR
jgi:hypothetical protein